MIYGELVKDYFDALVSINRLKRSRGGLCQMVDATVLKVLDAAL